MALEIEGNVIFILPEQSGTSQAGKTWRKQSFVIETQEQYPKKIIFNVWGENVDSVKQLSTGTKVKVNFRAESRQFNDRWYTDLTAWKITKVIEQGLTNNTSSNPPANQPTPPSDDTIYNDNNSSSPAKDIDIKADDSEEDDLPF